MNAPLEPESWTHGMVPVRQHRLTLSVVVPCYNEGAVVDELHRRLTLACGSSADDSYELVLVNDGSSDGTWAVVQRGWHKMMSASLPSISHEITATNSHYRRGCRWRGASGFWSSMLTCRIRRNCCPI
jgi:Glycosyl transferase family 2